MAVPSPAPPFNSSTNSTAAPAPGPPGTLEAAGAAGSLLSGAKLAPVPAPAPHVHNHSDHAHAPEPAEAPAPSMLGP